jgi:hypothetical protein
MRTNFLALTVSATCTALVIFTAACGDSPALTEPEVQRELPGVAVFPDPLLSSGGARSTHFRSPEWQRVLDIGKTRDPHIEEWKALSREIDKLLKKRGKTAAQAAEELSRIDLRDPAAGGKQFAALLGISDAENQRLAARAAKVLEAVYKRYPELKDPQYLRNTICQPRRSSGNFAEISVMEDEFACEEEQRKSNMAFGSYLITSGACITAIAIGSPMAIWTCSGAVMAWRVYTEANYALEYCHCVTYFKSRPDTYGSNPESYCRDDETEDEDGDGGVWN